MTVRRALVDDVEAMAGVMAAVAGEGLIGTESPVDVDAVRRRFRDTITGPGPAAMWVFELEGRILGQAGLHETGAAGVLAFGAAILPGRPRAWRWARAGRVDPRSRLRLLVGLDREHRGAPPVDGSGLLCVRGDQSIARSKIGPRQRAGRSRPSGPGLAFASLDHAIWVHRPTPGTSSLGYGGSPSSRRSNLLTQVLTAC